MDFEEEISKIMADLEKNMESKKDFEYVKNTFTTIISNFLKEANQSKEQKLAILEQKQSELEAKLEKFEETVKKIEKDIYVNDTYDFEIICPYCNCEFETELDELKMEVRCPECNNLIELDWNENECHDDCSCCHGCDEEEIVEDFEPKDEEQGEEDDM